MPGVGRLNINYNSISAWTVGKRSGFWMTDKTKASKSFIFTKLKILRDYIAEGVATALFWNIRDEKNALI